MGGLLAGGRRDQGNASSRLWQSADLKAGTNERMTSTTTVVDLSQKRPTRLTLSAVLIREGKVLLLRHGKDAEFFAGTWDLPLLHGAVGDTPEDLLVDGMREQLGIEVSGFHLHTVRDSVDERTGQVLRRFVFRVHDHTGEIKTDGTRRWYSEKEFADVFQLNPVVAGIDLFGG